MNKHLQGSPLCKGATLKGMSISMTTLKYSYSDLAELPVNEMIWVRCHTGCLIKITLKEHLDNCASY